MSATNPNAMFTTSRGMTYGEVVTAAPEFTPMHVLAARRMMSLLQHNWNPQQSAEREQQAAHVQPVEQVDEP